MGDRPPVLHIATDGLNGMVASGSSNVESRFERTSHTDKSTSMPRSLSLNSKTRRRDTITGHDRLHPWTTALKRSASKREHANSSTTSLASSATSHSEYATDSAYGTLDEYDDSPGEEGDETEGADSPQWASRSAPGWRDRVERSFQYRAQRRVQAVLDEEEWSRRVERAALSTWWQSAESDVSFVQGALAEGHHAQSSHNRACDFGGSYLAERVGAFYGSSDSLASSPTSPSPPSSRSSPEPSEYGDADAVSAAAAIRRELRDRRQRLPSLGDGSLAGQPSALLRRHTLPRRRASRSRLSPTKSIRNAITRTDEPSRASEDAGSRAVSPHNPVLAWPRRHPLTLVASLATVVVSTTSALSTASRVVPVSPVHLRNPPSVAGFAVEVGNAVLAPFLAFPSVPSVVLTVANLYLLAKVEREHATRSLGRKAAVGGALWCATVLLRATLSHVLGRLVGWAHPQLLSTSAIHEVGHGLTPLLLSLVLIIAIRDWRVPDCTTLSMLAAGVLLPPAAGGSGRWLPLCGAIVGAVFGILQLAFAATRERATTNGHKRSAASNSANIFALLLLPPIAHFFAPASRSPVSLDQSFSSLHPTDPNLLTVLLMTAPRPGNPDFLMQTIESWLDAFPAPSAESAGAYVGNWTDTSCARAGTSTSSRIKMVVYTHFADHDVFDAARSRFDADPKARHYIEWHRDPRAVRAQNRLDQRLHVARGLAYAASHETAYVLLTEDDFPLCGDTSEDGRTKTWQQLQRALVRTNELMPDVVLDGDRSPGHCGLFFATGGSGFAIRRPIAARLPALLLGEDDVDGTLREAAAERGEVVLKREGEDADTPDLVIQDCLRGKLPECADLCAPNVAFAPEGSARRAGGLLGDRYGKSGLAGTERLLQRHLGYNASTLPGRSYGREEWACGWRQPFNGEPDVLTV